VRLILHALTSPEGLPEARSGLRGEPLVRLDDDAFVAWETEFQDTGGPFDRRDLLEHHEIISHLHAAVDACLPAGFPRWWSADMVRQRRDVVLKALQRVTGRSEVAVTAVWRHRRGSQRHLKHRHQVSATCARDSATSPGRTAVASARASGRNRAHRRVGPG
jgi:hypothetical protein